MNATNERPAHGAGHYLRDIIYGALDGVVTTLAILAGVAGASLGATVAIILGLANLAADGFSMGASNYLALRSDLQQRGLPVGQEDPVRHGAATYAAFVLAGAVPLLPYLVGLGDHDGAFPGALVLSGAVLFLVGAWRSPFVNRSRTRCGSEMLLVGGLAAAVAYAIGRVAEVLIA